MYRKENDSAQTESFRRVCLTIKIIIKITSPLNLNIIKTTKILYIKLIIVYKTFVDSEVGLTHHHFAS